MKTDRQLQHDVLAELEWDPSIEASKIGVTATNDVVTLTGAVATFREKCQAETIAKRVYGVRAVANDIEIALPGTHKRSDADIATAALTALQWDPQIDAKKLKLAVREGWVTLEGTCDWKYQSEAAESHLRTLAGVRGVSNKIAIVSSGRAADVKQRIEDAFRRSANIEARRLLIDSTDGRVVLRGHVRSWTERNQAQAAAWSAPGVLEVDNQLAVIP
jgi:osmotically-inducible protein OsmY